MITIFPKFLDFLNPVLFYTGGEAAAAAVLAEEAALLGTLGAGATAFAPAAGGAGLFGSMPFMQFVDPVSLAFQGGGGLMKMIAGEDAADRRTRLLNAMTDYQKGLGKQSADLASKYVDESSPEARAARLAEAEASNKAGYDASVGAAQAFEKTGDPSGKLSDAYRSAQASSADAISRRNKLLIESLSKMRAPGVVANREGIRYGRAAGEQSALMGASESVGRAGQVDIANVKEDPFMNLGGEVLSGVGQGIALKNAVKRASKGISL